MHHARASEKVEELHSDVERLFFDKIVKADKEEVIHWAPGDTKQFIEELIEKLPSDPVEKKVDIEILRKEILRTIRVMDIYQM
ncbi:unnamed protein product [Caenorhabditis brenneri]